jgi:hypothetical protein
MIKSRAEHISHMEEMRNMNTILICKPEWKREHGRLVHRWEDSIKIYLKMEYGMRM